MLSLGLGIGANSALFSVVDALVLRPLPLPEADRLYLVVEQKSGRDTTSNPPRMYDWQARVSSFAAIMGSYGETVPMAPQNGIERLRVERTCGDVRGVLGANPARGRGFAVAEQRGDGQAVAILTHEAWQRRFGGRDSVLDEAITLNGLPFTVIGVMPPKAVYPPEIDIIAPMPKDFQDIQSLNRRAGYLNATARLKPGVGIAQARAELNTVMSQLANEYPDSESILHGIHRAPR